MKVFCDTNVLISAFLTNHPQHNAARPVLERIKARIDEGWAATHSLAETYAVLTRLPGANQVVPSITWQLIAENILKNFSLIGLSATAYSKTLEKAAASDIEGGKIYDALLLAAAVKSGAERIYTFNVTHFQSMADVDLQKRIVAP
jgi:predicted nucleic acid-binding protein